MKFLLFGSQTEDIKPLVKKYGFEVVEKNAEAVISYGGDGTLMKAEHKYPGVPKLILRASLVCKKCPPYSNEKILEMVKTGNFEVEDLIKLEASVGNKKVAGINDIVIHNANPRHAIRYRYALNGKEHAHPVIGDGVIVATPFGSSAYYRSITNSTFQKGIGLAFNNSTEPFDHMVLDESATLTINIVRGPAVVFADNQPDEIELDDGNSVHIYKSLETAKIFTF